MSLFRSHKQARSSNKLEIIAEALHNGTDFAGALSKVKLTAKQYLALVAARDPVQWETDIAAAKEILRARKG
jgi:hypothetical protein